MIARLSFCAKFFSMKYSPGKNILEILKYIPPSTRFLCFKSVNKTTIQTFMSLETRPSLMILYDHWCSWGDTLSLSIVSYNVSLLLYISVGDCHYLSIVVQIKFLWGLWLVDYSSMMIDHMREGGFQNPCALSPENHECESTLSLVTYPLCGLTNQQLTLTHSLPGVRPFV